MSPQQDVIYDIRCPFKFDSIEVCLACDGEFLETDRSLSFDCEDAIANHCKNNYKEDVDACLDFPEIVIGGDCDYDRLPQSAVANLELGVTQGRNGKGTIFTFASGNAHREGDDVNFNGWTNSRYAITVGAVGKDGYHADYSTGGAALVVVAPAGDDEDIGHLMTAGIRGPDSCADSGQGSSFACPVVSGVIALMLEANPDLSWRDVQAILAQTSRAVDDSRDDSQTTNGAGFWHSNWYGFGIVDAKAAVEAAMDWEHFSDELQAIGLSASENAVLSDSENNEFVSTIQLDPILDGFSDSFAAEATVVLLDLAHYNRGDLEIELVSPSGTSSVLHPGKRPEDNQLTGGERWKLMTVRNWGEDPTGNWQLKIRDLVERVDTGDDNIFRSWKLIIYGRDTSVLGSATIPATNPPTKTPTISPSERPTGPPTRIPTENPTLRPTDPPTKVPTENPTITPTSSPTGSPTTNPSNPPTRSPTEQPTNAPTKDPAENPTNLPTISQTNMPTSSPTNNPTNNPTKFPTNDPTTNPTNGSRPTVSPTSFPTNAPTNSPKPTESSTRNRTNAPTNSATLIASNIPTEPKETDPKDPEDTTGISLVSEIIPENFSCEAAMSIPLSGTVEGTIGSFPLLNLEGSCLTGFETGGGWYQTTGNGNIFSLTACSLDNSTSVGVSVFTGECSELGCIEHQSRQLADHEPGNCQAISFTTKIGTIYKVLVSGLPVGAAQSSSFNTPRNSSFEQSFERRHLMPELENDYWIKLSETEVASNSKCGSADPVSFGSLVEGSTLGLLTTYKTCEDTIKSGSWYTVEGGEPTEWGTIVYQASTCNLESDFYNAISVYRGDRCGSHECVDVDILPCPDGSPGQQLFWSATSEENYQIFVHSADTIEASQFNAGSFQMSLVYSEGLKDSNRTCTAALEFKEQLIDQNGVVTGTTSGSKPDMMSIESSSCGTGGSGTWYHITGTGAVFQASTCLSETDHKTSIHIYSGDCNELTCIDSGGGNNALCNDDKGSVVNFQTEMDADYYILVASRENNIGNFGLEITEIMPPDNNECDAAIALQDSPILGSTLESTVDFYPGDYCGTSLDTPGVWYEIDGTGGGMKISTCQEESFDSAVSVFKGSCNRLECVAGSSATDSSCTGVPGAAVSFLSEANTKYLVYVHGKSGSLTTMGNFTVSHNEFDVVDANEFCSSAISIPLDGSRIQGSTENASQASVPTSSCGIEITNPGLWYTFPGNGHSVEISACSRGEGGFVVSASVFAGGPEGCGSLTCMTGKIFAENICTDVKESRNLEGGPLGPAFRLLTEKDKDYYVFVHGNGADNVGGFELFVRDEGNIGRSPILTSSPSESPSGSPSESPSESPTEIPIRHGKDLHRWVPINSDPLEIHTDYLELEMIDPPKGNATIEGHIITYTPPLNFSGDDTMTVDGCTEEGCYRFDLIINVMGEKLEFKNDEGWNKRLLLLLLLLLIPCISLPMYLMYRNKNRNDGVNYETNTVDESEPFGVGNLDQHVRSSLYGHSSRFGSEHDSNVDIWDSSNVKSSQANYASHDDTTGKNNYDSTTGNYNYSSSDEGSRTGKDTHLTDSTDDVLNEKFSDEGRRSGVQ